MKKIEIRHRRDNDKVLGTAEVNDTEPQQIRAALEFLTLAGANLAGANLDGANLDGAYLDGAYLAGANLAGANLTRANLTRANLTRANLAGAYLDGAYLDGAYLDGANLDGAYLTRANLTWANLDGANLAGANLDGANLAGANLDGANLAGANLTRAYLAGANLTRANLAGANLAGANLDGANLDGANLDGAYLAGANLDGAKNLPDGIKATDPPEPYRLPPRTLAAQTERARRYREAHPDVPVVDQLDAKILARVDANPGCFDMKEWHCGTTHCRAGQAIDVAGKAGYELERKLRDPARAGAMIYMASVGFVPWFYDPSTEHALADIRRCAAEQSVLTDA